MKRVFSKSLLSISENGDYEESGRKFLRQETAWREKVEDEESQFDDVADQVTCINLHRKVDEPPCENYGLWRQEQKARAAKIEKQLKARWALEELIEDQLNQFYSHYNRANNIPIRPKDVAQLLMPKETPAHELAALAWLGDWRPSAILGLLRSLARATSSSAMSSSFSDSVGIEQALSQIMHEIKIEETVIDEEMAEIQANCVRYLPFGPAHKQKGGSALACVQSELKKIHRVIMKAQNLRFKALEIVVKKVLSHTDAAEFLVSFVGIQDMIHQLAMQHKPKKSPVKVPKTE